MSSGTTDAAPGTMVYHHPGLPVIREFSFIAEWTYDWMPTDSNVSGRTSVAPCFFLVIECKRQWRRKGCYFSNADRLLKLVCILFQPHLCVGLQDLFGFPTSDERSDEGTIFDAGFSNLQVTHGSQGAQRAVPFQARAGRYAGGAVLVRKTKCRVFC